MQSSLDSNNNLTAKGRDSRLFPHALSQGVLTGDLAIFLHGVYTGGINSHPLRFRIIRAPSAEDLVKLMHTIASRVARYLERRGLLVRDTGQGYRASEALGGDDETPMNHLLGSSITYRIAVGP